MDFPVFLNGDDQRIAKIFPDSEMNEGMLKYLYNNIEDINCLNSSIFHLVFYILSRLYFIIMSMNQTMTDSVLNRKSIN